MLDMTARNTVQITSLFLLETGNNVFKRSMIMSAFTLCFFPLKLFVNISYFTLKCDSHITVGAALYLYSEYYIQNLVKIIADFMSRSRKIKIKEKKENLLSL